MTVKRQLLTVSAAAVVCLTSIHGTASAQGTPPFDQAINLQLFNSAVGPKTFMTVDDASIADKGRFNVDFMMTFLTDPFTIYEVDEANDSLDAPLTEVVSQLFAGDLSGAYGLTDKLHLGVSLPLVFRIRGDGIDPANPMGNGDSIRATGFGDMLVEGKLRLSDNGPMRLAAIGGVTLPTSVGAGGSAFLGDDLPTARARVAAQWTNGGGRGPLSVGANLGVILRKPRELYASTVGQQVVYKFAGAYRVNERVTVIAELFGNTGLTNIDLDASPLEAGGSVRVRANSSFSVIAGGGAGLVSGIGSPGLRIFAAVGWSPDFRDTDGDGIANQKDKCPVQPEDRDGFEDDDGCPDLDNDGDLRPDVTDKCPNKAEDFDGFEDDDGCPEADNDGDGIPDASDRCKNDKEDGLKPYPKDGCPGNKRDSDGDGVWDAYDKCPRDEEDADGFEDEDGCPDKDNDGDGIADADDKCPLCAEDKDGVEDGDGCPDLATHASFANGRITLKKQPDFRSGGTLSKGGKAVVDEIAFVMQSQPTVAKWVVVVGVRKGRSAARAKQQAGFRAVAIRARLVAAGVDASRLQVVGAVSTSSRVAIVARGTRDAGDDTKRFCPAKYRATPKPATGTGG